MAHTGDLLTKIVHKVGVILIQSVVSQVQKLIVDIVPI